MMSVDVLKDEADKLQYDASRVEGLDPAFHYRWVRVDGSKEANRDVNLMRRRLDGYELVERNTERSLLDATTRVKEGSALDNTIRWGDLVLARTPKENYERRLRQERARIARQTIGVTQQYKDAIRRVTGEERLAYVEHKDPSGVGGYKTSHTSAEKEEMTEAQMQTALKLAAATTESEE